jgi:hypothetical protein
MYEDSLKYDGTSYQLQISATARAIGEGLRVAMGWYVGFVSAQMGGYKMHQP